MSLTLDFNLFPMVRDSGHDITSFPGLLIASPPRRAVRSRSEDTIILYLDLVGNPPLAPEKFTQVLTDLSNLYFNTPGSTSTTLRTVAESLNDTLSKRNLGMTGSGQQTIGLFTQVVIRKNGFYMAQSGPVQAYLMNEAGIQLFYEPSITGRGLGLGRTTLVRFTQAELKPDDILFLVSHPSPGWNESVVDEARRQGLEGLRRKLYDRSVANLNAVLIHARSGKGNFQIVAGSPAAVMPEPEHIVPIVVSAGSSVPAVSSDNLMITPKSEDTPNSSMKVVGGAAVVASITTPPPPQVISSPSPAPGQAKSGIETGQNIVKTSSPAGSTSSASTGVSPEKLAAVDSIPLANKTATGMSGKSEGKSGKTNAFLVGVAAVGDTIGGAFHSVGQAIGGFLARLVPEGFFEIPNSLMAFIAVAVPVVVVTAASVVYFQLGRAVEGRQLYMQAGEQVLQAMEKTDPLAKRADLLTALDTLSQAENAGGVPAAQIDELGNRLRSELDLLDEIRRVNYQPAFQTQLDPQIHISQMVNIFDDLYLLDQVSGSVLHAIPSSQGYLTDDEFLCGPDVSGGMVGPIISMAVWPAGYDPSAAIVGMDATGNLIFCKPGENPSMNKLDSPESSPSGFSNLVALTIDQANLYVLDRGGNSVWLYPNLTFQSEPVFYFGAQVPDLKEAIDLAANNDELYLLFTDGHLTLCIFGVQGMYSTSCVDPQNLVDYRKGRENAPFSAPNPFTQINANPSPDPSLYLLDAVGQSIYHFSFRTLGFLRLFSPIKTLPGGDSTAFTVNGPGRMLFLAIGNQVFYGVMP